MPMKKPISSLNIPKNQEIYYIISANKQRSKTAPQLCEEIDELWKYYSSGKTNVRPKKGALTSHPLGKTRDLVVDLWAVG